MKLGKLQKKWLNALKSGKYQQTRSFLTDDGVGHCCLGVACEVLNLKREHDYYKYGNNTGDEIMPGLSWKKLKLRSAEGKINSEKLNDKKLKLFNEITDGKLDFSCLAGINDDSTDFSSVIEIIEKLPEIVFTGSV